MCHVLSSNNLFLLLLFNVTRLTNNNCGMPNFTATFRIRSRSLASNVSAEECGTETDACTIWNNRGVRNTMIILYRNSTTFM